MNALIASRTLVKSPPELWAECSDAASLARHLDGFGEIRITRLEPETAVAWEGELARGTVRLEPSGWGTKVTLTAEEPSALKEPVLAVEPVPVAVEPVPVHLEEPGPVEEPVSEGDVAPVTFTRSSFLTRLLGAFRGRREESTAETEPPGPEPEPPPPPGPEPPPPVPQPEPPPAPGPAVVPDSAVPPGAPRPEAREEPEDPDPAAQQALTAALDSLGQAHHRPFSRA